MGIVPGWVAFALAGVAVAPHAERSPAQVTYTVRMVEADGVGWRETVFTQLKPVTRQGSATVWTAPRGTTASLLASVAKSQGTSVTEAPRVTAFSGAPATIQCRRNRSLVTQVSFPGTDAASEAAPENLRVGWHTTMVGRKLDQGILVQVALEDTVIRAVHHVSVDRAAAATCASVASKNVPMPKVMVQGSRTGGVEVLVGHTAVAKLKQKMPSQPSKTADTDQCCDASDCGAKSDAGVGKVVLDIPEIDTQEVVGEWLIPHGEILLVSFGAKTVADKAGKAVVKERLAIIEADEAPEVARAARLQVNLPTINVPIPRMPDPAPKVAMPTPIMPSRSIPQGVNADGTPADLPPLPADEAEADKSASESSEPMPSPQTKKIPAPPKPAADTGTNKAEFMDFSLPKAANMFLPGVFMPGSTTGFQFLLPMKPFSVKLPFGQKLEVGILGKVVPEAN